MADDSKFQSLIKCQQIVEYPSVAVLQNVDWSEQATLLPSISPKCFLGYDSGPQAPSCATLSPGEVLTVSSCSCKDSWTPEPKQTLIWANTNYTYMAFKPAPYLAADRPMRLLSLQVFFQCMAASNHEQCSALPPQLTNNAVDNAQRAKLQNGGVTPGPGLSVAVHDPSLDLETALSRNVTRIMDIAALGVSSLNLGLRYRTFLNQSAVYDYDMSISTNQALDLPCDSSNGGDNSAACYASIYVRYPSLLKVTIAETYAMNWVVSRRSF